MYTLVFTNFLTGYLILANYFIFVRTTTLHDNLVSERIVTNLIIIESPHGVPLDFNYNETSSHNNQLLSSPGCPKSVDSFPWIYFYHQNPMRTSSLLVRGELRCHLAGTQGPCHKGQILFVQSNSNCGTCGCECLLENQWIKQNDDQQQRYQVCYSKNAAQGQAYDKLDKKVCFNLGEKGPCHDGKVLVVSYKFTTDGMTKSEVTCLPACDFNDDNWFLKQGNGECTVVSNANGGVISGAGFAANLPASDCPEEERYSRTLKKCVKRRPNLVLG